MTNTAYKTRKLLSMLSCAEKENDGLMLTHNLQNMQRNGKQTGCYGLNRIIYTFFKTLAVLFVLFIFLSISALAQSFTLHNIALLVVSVICLNKCCGMMLAAKAERK